MDKSELLKKHEGSIWRLLKIYNSNGDLYKGKFLLISLSLDIILTIFTLFSKTNIYNVIENLTDLYLGMLPNLLGFNLGAYALLIGLASSDLIDKMSSTFKTKFTSFQRASSVFGFCVLFLVLALIVTFLFKAFITIQEESVALVNFIDNPTLIKTINFLSLFVLNFFGIYSIFILLSVVRSIFAISQAAHFFAVTNRIKAEQEDDVKKDDADSKS